MVKKLKFLKHIFAPKYLFFNDDIKIFGPNFSYINFEAVDFWDFWGPAEMRGNDFEENKVVPSIFMQLWSRNHVNKLDRLTPQAV